MKIPRKITKEIRFYRDFMLVDDNKRTKIYASLACSFFGWRPMPSRYDVTYALDKDGEYTAHCYPEPQYTNFIDAGMKTFPVCFLPYEWNGKRVRRTIFTGLKNPEGRERPSKQSGTSRTRRAK